MWDLVSIEKAQNTLGKKLIHMTMNACVHVTTLILSDTFCKQFQHSVELDFLHFKICQISVN